MNKKIFVCVAFITIVIQQVFGIITSVWRRVFIGLDVQFVKILYQWQNNIGIADDLVPFGTRSSTVTMLYDWWIFEF